MTTLSFSTGIIIREQRSATVLLGAGKTTTPLQGSYPGAQHLGVKLKNKLTATLK